MNNKSQSEDFFDALCDFNFHVIFHKEKYSKGKVRIDQYTGEVSINPDEDYWDFDIIIGGFKAFELIDNRRVDEYYDHLMNAFRTYEIERSIESLKIRSKADAFDLLSTELSRLKRVQNRFIERSDYYNELTEETSLSYLSHRDLRIIPDSPEKYSKDDFLISRRLSELLGIRRLVIKEAINFLDNKLNWWKLANDMTFSTEMLYEGKMDKHLVWKRDDTDLLELITALLEVDAISKENQKLTRKEAVEFFSEIFDKQIKDPESKLTTATSYRFNPSQFTTELKLAIDKYATKKLERKKARS